MVHPGRSHDDVFDQDTLILHLPTKTTPFELFLTDHWFTRRALERRRRVHVERFDRQIPIPTPEDFILLKACYWRYEGRRASKKAQDGVDIESVFEANRASIEGAYLEENGRKLDVWRPLSDLLGLT